MLDKPTKQLLRAVISDAARTMTPDEIFQKIQELRIRREYTYNPEYARLTYRIYRWNQELGKSLKRKKP